MKILAFADIHASDWAIGALANQIKKHKPDLAINVGDFSIFEEGLETTLDKLDMLGVPIITIHGNHETDAIVEYVCRKSKNLMYMHESAKEIDGITFIAWGGGGFSKVEPMFEDFAKSIKNLKKPAVLITHAPIYKTKADKLHSGEHVGCKSFRSFVEKHKEIVLALSGHIHDSFYTQDKVNNTIVINPGPTGTIIEIKNGKVSCKFEKLKDMPDMY